MAQGYIGDARRVGMGGAGDWGNTAWDLVGEESGYRSIPIPIGLFQVLSDFDVFDPESDEFNPALIMSYASSPMHYSFNRGGSDVGRQFLLDIVNAEISRDLSTYSGFVPRSSLTGGGVASPDWGKTFWISGDGVGSDHGFRVAAGPYISMDAGLSLDPDLVAAFNGPDPDASYAIDSQTAAQGAAALTLGYRGRFFLPDAVSDRDGVYIAVNYKYLYGIYYTDVDIDVRFDTDDMGLLTLFPTTEPVGIDVLASNNGAGFALDFAGAVVRNGWEFTVAADGVGNRMDWEDLTAQRYAIRSVIDGSDFEETVLPSPSESLRVELPVRYSGGAAYHADAWSVTTEVAHGFQDIEFRGGVEYRLGPIDVRGGTRYSNELLHPAWGAGFNITDGFGVDVAFFGAASNVERKRELGMALSLRLTAQQ